MDFGYGSLAVVCDNDNRSLGVVVGIEARFDWLEELIRGEKVEKACCATSRKSLSLKGAKSWWIWVEEIVRSRETLMRASLCILKIILPREVGDVKMDHESGITEYLVSIWRDNGTCLTLKEVTYLKIFRI